MYSAVDSSLLFISVQVSEEVLCLLWGNILSLAGVWWSAYRMRPAFTADKTEVMTEGRSVDRVCAGILGEGSCCVGTRD